MISPLRPGHSSMVLLRGMIPTRFMGPGSGTFRCQSSAGVLGILGVKPTDPDGVITHEQERILTAFANQMALALERVNLVRTSRGKDK